MVNASLVGMENAVAATGGLQPGQRISFEQAKWLYSSGYPNFLSPDGDYSIYGGLQGFLAYWETILLRLTAQKAADDAYAAYTAARIANLDTAAAMLVFDANGRATDESVAAANNYQNYEAPTVAVALDALAAAEENVAQTSQYIAAQVEQATVAALPVTYSDIELSTIIDDRLKVGELPGVVQTYLVRDLGVELDRSTRLVNARFAIIQAAQAAIQAAQAAAAAAATAQTAQVAQAVAQTAITQTSTDMSVKVQLPDNIAYLTPGQKAFLYLSLLFDAKLRDSEIRAAVEAQLGPQSDDSWGALQKLAFGEYKGDLAVTSGFVRYSVMKGTPLSELKKQIGDMYRKDITDAEWSQFVASDFLKMPFVFGGKGAIASDAQTAAGGSAAGGGAGLLIAAAAAAYFLLGA